jgi:prophage tail gpP-like protein
MQCRIFVNDQLELTGLIERRSRRCDKAGKTLTIEGRDLMGLLVDSYCESFNDVEGKTIRQLAELLLKSVPVINRKNIIGQLDLVGKLKTRKRRGTADFMSFFDAPHKLAKIAPGMTVFQALQTYALSRGVMFFSLPDGTFVFDEPLTGGDPDYNIAFTGEGGGNNALAADIDENISKRYSKVTVIGQQQRTDTDGLGEPTHNSPPGVALDDTFPFYKPFVACNNNDSQSPRLRARMMLNKMRHDGQSMEYEMPRHSQAGINFSINRMAMVNDTVHGITGNYLVTARTLCLDKQAGPTTKLRLGLPGLVAGETGRHK